MIQEKVQVRWNQEEGPGYYRMGLSCHGRYARALPGQFIMLRVSTQTAPLLRRPFSIHGRIMDGSETTGIEILFKVVGTATALLARCRKGDTLDMLGPLGNGFGIPDPCGRVYIAAGGIGVAPMAFLAKHLQEKGVDLSNCALFLGGRSRGDLLCGELFEKLGMPVHITTDDGSSGDQCFLTHPLEQAIQRARPDRIYACGPMQMLGCIAGFAKTYALSCQVSIETLMACGMGACLGCAVKPGDGREGYLHACLHGPVFDAHLIEF